MADMTFEDLLEEQERRSNVCSVELWRREQTPQIQESFARALASNTTTSTAIYRAMKTLGYDKKNAAPIQRHRRKECDCDSV